MVRQCRVAFARDEDPPCGRFAREAPNTLTPVPFAAKLLRMGTAHVTAREHPRAAASAAHFAPGDNWLLRRGFALFALALLFLWPRPAVADTVVVEPGFTELGLGKRLEVAYDPTGLLTFDDVRSGKVQFAPSAKDVPSFGYRTGATWARFAIDDRRPESAEVLVLEHGYGQTDRLEVFDFAPADAATSAPRLRLSGDQVPLAEWETPGRFPRFSVARGRREFYVKSFGTHSHQLPFALRTRTADEAHRRSDVLAQSLFFGALLIMAAYNALVAIATRSAAYAYYVGYLLSSGVGVMAVGGMLVFAHPAKLALLNFATPWSIGATACFSLVFAVNLLGLSPRHGWGRSVKWLSVAIPSVILGATFAGYPVALRTALLLVLPWAVVLVGSGVSEARRGSRVAKLFLLAWGVFIAGALVILAKSVGLVSTNAVTNNALQVGSALEFLLLSFALADRIKQLQALATANAKLAQEASHHALAEEKRLGAEREQFVANTSHELRTPLNGMLGLVQAVLLRDGAALSAASLKGLDGVVRSGQRLASLVNDLLDLSAAQQSGLVLRRAPTSVRAQAELVLDLLRPTSRGVFLNVELPANLPAADADPQRLQQVLFNLVGNAIKFTEEGSIRVGAQVAEGKLVVRVTDTGPGIAAKDQQRIFEAFQQADGGIARRYGGTGLGLAITKQIIDAHGGTLGVTSTPGFGSTFWFTLPISSEAAVDGPTLASVVVDKAQALHEQLMAGGGETAGNEPQRPIGTDASPAAMNGIHQEISGLAVLVVDDEAINRQVLGELLPLAGHSVQFATNGREAVAAVRARKPDVVLLDVMMPVMSGYDALVELRTMHDELDLPVLLLTARAQEKDLVAGFKRGATDYIIKPFSAAEVLARVNHQARLIEARIRAAQLRAEGASLRVTLAEAEEQLLHAQRLASLGAATAGVAHDLRNPLHHVTAIFGWIHEGSASLVAPNEEAKARITEWSTMGATAGKAAMSISEALRKASRSDAGPAELIRVDDVVDDALIILGHKLKNVQLARIRDEEAVVLGRRTELLQVVMNLVGNAADAVSAGPRRELVIGVSREGETVRFSVEDSGPGVPEANRERILELFFTTKPSGEGTGLGLSTVVTVAKRWGGSVEVGTSKSLGGASFTFTAPRAL